MAIRLAVLAHHYRRDWDWTDAGLEAAAGPAGPLARGRRDSDSDSGAAAAGGGHEGRGGGGRGRRGGAGGHARAAR